MTPTQYILVGIYYAIPFLPFLIPLWRALRLAHRRGASAWSTPHIRRPLVMFIIALLVASPSIFIGLYEEATGDTLFPENPSILVPAALGGIMYLIAMIMSWSALSTEKRLRHEPEPLR